ncbi:MAG: hypothetical protein K2W82_15690 [Candidatus Obscuribacterales bacterium]|nr:hypothetical protein [Candidatus Obscuribacterales bacterium]
MNIKYYASFLLVALFAICGCTKEQSAANQSSQQPQAQPAPAATGTATAATKVEEYTIDQIYGQLLEYHLEAHELEKHEHVLLQEENALEQEVKAASKKFSASIDAVQAALKQAYAANGDPLQDFAAARKAQAESNALGKELNRLDDARYAKRKEFNETRSNRFKAEGQVVAWQRKLSSSAPGKSIRDFENDFAKELKNALPENEAVKKSYATYEAASAELAPLEAEYEKLRTAYVAKNSQWMEEHNLAGRATVLLNMPEDKVTAAEYAALREEARKITQQAADPTVVPRYNELSSQVDKARHATNKAFRELFVTFTQEVEALAAKKK